MTTEIRLRLAWESVWLCNPQAARTSQIYTWISDSELYHLFNDLPMNVSCIRRQIESASSLAQVGSKRPLKLKDFGLEKLKERTSGLFDAIEPE